MDTYEIARYLEAVAQYEAGGELGGLVDRLDALFLETAGAIAGASAGSAEHA
eukprot:COSAG06_NODE_35317_length_461_cov_1.447514_1_plen_51_part_01